MDEGSLTYIIAAASHIHIRPQIQTHGQHILGESHTQVIYPAATKSQLYNQYFCAIMHLIPLNQHFHLRVQTEWTALEVLYAGLINYNSPMKAIWKSTASLTGFSQLRISSCAALAVIHRSFVPFKTEAQRCD